jgi:hypothetical protein
MSKPNEVQARTYKAAKDYNEVQRKFVKSGRVDAAARTANPKSDAEVEERKRARSVAVTPKKKIPPHS